ncbi:MAG: hypothetical protein AAGF11_11815 [Myxococcota bacterium]
MRPLVVGTARGGTQIPNAAIGFSAQILERGAASRGRRAGGAADAALLRTTRWRP